MGDFAEAGGDNTLRLEEFTAEVEKRLSACAELEEAEICIAGENGFRKYPVTTPVIAVGFGGIRLENSSVDGDLGRIGRGKKAELDLSLSIASPKRAGDCTRLFSGICGAFPTDCGLGIRSVSASKAEYDMVCGCFRLEGLITVSAYLTEVGE